eukprot:m51a1_g2040 putative transmembrane protein c2orf18 homolog (427) ;mRNA; r:1355245-1356998
MSGTLTVKSGLMELGMLMTGVVDTILVKASDNSYSRGWGGKEHQFHHPYSQTLFMFTAETLCMWAFLASRFWKSKTKAESVQPMKFFEIFPPYLAITASLDFLGTSLSSIGLLYCKASVWQMLRGSLIIFSCIATRVLLKRKTLMYKWLAVSITIAGLILVGLSSVFTTTSSTTGSGSSEEESSSQPAWQSALGIVLVIVAMAMSGTQMVVQEYFVRKHRDLHPLQVPGTEGCFGVTLMIFVVLPITYFIPGNNPSSMRRGSFDNVIDAFMMMGNHIPLLFYILVYICSDAMFNFFGISITKYLSAVHRTIIDACRSILVWFWQLLTFYCINERYGEEWTKWSWFQVAGFVLLIIGAVIYNGIVRLPRFTYEDDEKPEGETEETGSELPKIDLSSPKCDSTTVAVELGAIDVSKPAKDNAELASSV